MQLTPLQIEIQKLGADMSLSFGCIISSLSNHMTGRIIKTKEHFDGDNIYFFVQKNGFVNSGMKSSFKEIIGHPITFNRLLYLHLSQEENKRNFMLYRRILGYFRSNLELYNQSILERPEELQLLVRDYLLSIQ